jgi:hypothetical protein
MAFVSSFFFAAIAAVSLLIHRPFTLQYARLEVEKNWWDSPYFFRANQIMTGVLGIIFLVMGLTIVYQTYSHSSWNPWIIWGIGFAFQFIFILTFPKWYKKRHGLL